MSVKYISKNNLFKLLDFLKKDYEVYVPVKKNEQRFYKRYTTPADDIVIGEVRPFEPLKAFFLRARQIVAEDFKPSPSAEGLGKDNIPAASPKPLAILGVKACDLKGFKIQDYVFNNHDYQDPFYIENREQNLIISTDCTSSLDTCFCLALGLRPHPEEGFDINLSEIKTGYIVETGSQKGKTLLERYSSLFQEAGKAFLNEKDKKRTRLAKEVEENIRRNNIPAKDLYKGIIEKNFESDIWTEEAKECVECGGCNTICPTCHCFLLYDQKDKKKTERLRIWDSCMLKDYARVAGGANPRPKLWMRLRNRFEKKFDFFPKVAQIYACTGCGRCISVCPAKIDIRKVLKRLVGNA